MDDLTVIEIESNSVKKNNRISSNTANEFDKPFIFFLKYYFYFISGKKHNIN